MKSPQNKKRGFTLVELMVAIGIVAVLSAITFVGVGEVRKSARDRQRETDLQTLRLAMKLYGERHGTYKVANSGFKNLGIGWISYDDNDSQNYETSVTEVLYNEGLISAKFVNDPKPVNGNNVADQGYMIYICNENPANSGKFRSFSISATKEKSASNEVEYVKGVCQGSTTFRYSGDSNLINTGYYKNYAVTN